MAEQPAESTGEPSPAWADLPPLDQAFFARSTLAVARDLIGAVLLVARPDGSTVAGRIVETEAYLDRDDPASHARSGPTPRSVIMFGPPGFAYVYIIYGMHHCLNLITETDGTAGAVLIRALEPLHGRAAMARRRGLSPDRAAAPDLCAGPGRLCRACGIDRTWNGLPVAVDLPASRPAAGSLRVFLQPDQSLRIEATGRIGIKRARKRLYRFIAAGHPCLSD